MDDRRSAETGWHGSLQLSFSYWNLKSSPPMSPRFFTGIRVVKVAEEVLKTASKSFKYVLGYSPTRLLRKIDFPYLSQPCSSMEVFARVWYSKMQLVFFVWGCARARVKRSSMALLLILELSIWPTLKHGVVRLRVVPKFLNLLFSRSSSSYLR